RWLLRLHHRSVDRRRVLRGRCPCLHHRTPRRDRGDGAIVEARERPLVAYAWRVLRRADHRRRGECHLERTRWIQLLPVLDLHGDRAEHHGAVRRPRRGDPLHRPAGAPRGSDLGPTRLPTRRRTVGAKHLRRAPPPGRPSRSRMWEAASVAATETYDVTRIR